MSRPTLFLFAILLASVGTSGCEHAPNAPRHIAPTVDACAELSSNQSLELGTGSSGFIALETGDEVGQAWGPQGGDHVWASLRMRGIFGGGDWRDNPECEELDGGMCGPIAPEDAPRATVNLWHNETLIASTGEDRPFAAVDGVATGLTAFLQWPYSTAEMAWMELSDISQEDIDAAEAAEAAELRFEVLVRDACGTVLSDERTVSIQIEWLQQEDVGLPPGF